MIRPFCTVMIMRPMQHSSWTAAVCAPITRYPDRSRPRKNKAINFSTSQNEYRTVQMLVQVTEPARCRSGGDHPDGSGMASQGFPVHPQVPTRWRVSFAVQMYSTEIERSRGVARPELTRKRGLIRGRITGRQERQTDQSPASKDQKYRYIPYPDRQTDSCAVPL